MFGLSLLALLKGVWFASLRPSADRALRGEDVDDLLARRAYLARRVTAQGFGPGSFPDAVGDPFRGEWAIVSLSMTALATAGLAQRHGALLPEARADLRSIAERALSPGLAAFDTGKWREEALASLEADSGHIGYLGHLALALATSELLSPGGPHRALLGRIAEALPRKLARGPCGLAETYPGETYFPDNAVALAALALAERAGVAPADSPSSSHKLLATVHRAHADPATGLLPFRLGPGCRATSEARASGAAFSLLYLAHVDEAYARRGYEVLSAHFVDRPLPGLVGVREWPRGVERGGDIDSGPLFFGLSPAATGFTIALAHRAGDATTLQGLLDTAELAGFTLPWPGHRAYLTAPIVGDAILLSARAPLRDMGQAGGAPTLPATGSASAAPAPVAPAGR